MSERSHEKALLAKRLARFAREMTDLVETTDLDAIAGEAQIFGIHSPEHRSSPL